MFLHLSVVQLWLICSLPSAAGGRLGSMTGTATPMQTLGRMANPAAGEDTIRLAGPYSCLMCCADAKSSQDKSPRQSSQDGKQQQPLPISRPHPGLLAWQCILQLPLVCRPFLFRSSWSAVQLSSPSKVASRSRAAACVKCTSLPA